MSHISMSDLHIKGYAEKNFPTPMTKPPRVPGGPTHPPPTPCRKTLILNFGAKIQIYGAKIQIFSAKTQICSSQTQICGAKNQIFDPKFKSINFCTTKNLPLCTRKPPNLAGLGPTHPPWVLTVLYTLSGLERQEYLASLEIVDADFDVFVRSLGKPSTLE